MSKKKSSVDEFLKKDNPNLEALKKKYFDNNQGANPQDVSYIPPTEESQQKLEEYVAFKRSTQQTVPLRTRFRNFITGKFKVEVGQRSIYIWRSRKFEEVAYLHLPRFAFLSFSCYLIYRIKLKQMESQRWKAGVRSERQEAVEKQIAEISTVIGAYQGNQFDPNKTPTFDKNYKDDALPYLYQKEEKEL